jgi:hypothetical protein
MKTVYTLLILAVLFGLGGFIQGVALNGQVFMSIVLALAAIMYAELVVNRTEAEIEQ